MSDNWIRLIPDDPTHIPDASRQREARDRFAKLAPEADEVRTLVFAHVTFIDCGANLEVVRCPSCGRELSLAWWQDRMDAEARAGLALSSYATPCCGSAQTLDELTYDAPAGFARFVLEAVNPRIARLADEHRRELEVLLGIRLRVIYRHL